MNFKQTNYKWSHTTIVGMLEWENYKLLAN